MPAPAASVIVVSRHRPEALQRCLTALFQQDHPQFELIVVADPAAVALTEDSLRRAGQPAKVLTFEEANISAARNLGLRHAAAGVVAFLDDDAVPEPSWLTRLAMPFADPRVAAATGFVRGRNGISFQWRASEVDHLAQDHDLVVTGPTLRQGTSQRAVKTQGTNCAFRHDPLLAIGGFDPALRFYLDEADVNLRLAPWGVTAIIPDAEVHHGYLPSERRNARRVPLDLHDIGASTAVYLRKHATEADLDPGWQRLLAREQARISRHGLRPAAAETLLRSLQDGWNAGLVRPLAALAPLHQASASFLPLIGTGPRPGCILAGRIWQRRRLLAQARTERQRGAIVTVFCLSPTARPHRVAFLSEGIWVQTGGLFGRSLREGSRIRLVRFKTRLAEELRRIAGLRPVN